MEYGTGTQGVEGKVSQIHEAIDRLSMMLDELEELSKIAVGRLAFIMVPEKPSVEDQGNVLRVRGTASDMVHCLEDRAAQVGRITDRLKSALDRLEL